MVITDQLIEAPVVISYLRFSTPDQAMGDSERRQFEAVEKFAANRGLQLANNLKFADRGISAFKGKNRERGRGLNKILELVQTGVIPYGSILAVENTDRLSRQDFLNAFEIISAIIRAGITIHTFTPEADYDVAALQGGQIYMLIAQIQLAHEESLKKSNRITASREQARRNARDELKVLTSMAPAWLRVVKDGDEKRFETIPEAVETVQMIFEMKLQGLSRGKIESNLNATAPWRRPNGWRQSYIAKILSNRAVMGEYQPHIKRDGKRMPEGDPISNYYPAIIEREKFHAVQALLAQNKGKGGRTGKCANLFGHLAKCAYCTGPMRFMDKGKPPKGAQYLVCDRACRRAGCQRHNIRYDEFERTVLEFAYKLKPEQVLPNQDENQRECRALRQRIQGRLAEQADIGQQIDNLTDQISRTASAKARDRYELRVRQLEERNEAITEEIAKAQQHLKAAEEGAATLAHWQANLATLCSQLATGDVELRMRMKAHLQELIERIEVFPVGYKKLEDDDPAPHDHQTPRTKDDIVHYLEAVADECWPKGFSSKDKRHEFSKFVETVTKRRMSKEGRFYRVFWKMGGWLDAVPIGSLASGLRIIHDEEGKICNFITPDLGQ